MKLNKYCNRVFASGKVTDYKVSGKTRDNINLTLDTGTVVRCNRHGISGHDGDTEHFANGVVYGTDTGQKLEGEITALISPRKNDDGSQNLILGRAKTHSLA